LAKPEVGPTHPARADKLGTKWTKRCWCQHIVAACVARVSCYGHACINRIRCEAWGCALLQKQRARLRPL
jgi:hypothetical protein